MTAIRPSQAKYFASAKSWVMKTMVNPKFALQALEHFQQGDTDAHIDHTDGFVGDNQLRLDGQGAGDADALALSAAQLVRVLVYDVARRGQVHHRQQFPNPPLERRTAFGQAVMFERKTQDSPMVCAGLSEAKGS